MLRRVFSFSDLHAAARRLPCILSAEEIRSNTARLHTSSIKNDRLYGLKHTVLQTENALEKHAPGSAAGEGQEANVSFRTAFRKANSACPCHASGISLPGMTLLSKNKETKMEEPERPLFADSENRRFALPLRAALPDGRGRSCP